MYMYVYTAIIVSYFNNYDGYNKIAVPIVSRYMGTVIYC